MTQSQTPIPISEKPYGQTPYRYINLVIFLLAALVNSLPAQTFSSINSLVQQKFHIDALLVTLNTLMFPIVHPFASFFVNWILDHVGLKFGCSLGGVILLGGVWLRCLLDYDDVVLCLVGSALAALGNTFILNSPSKMASQWFSETSIPIVISLIVLTSNISVATGASLPGLFLSKDTTIEEFKTFFFIQAVIITVPILLLIILFKNKPKIPPSQTAYEQISQPKENYSETLKKMFTNREYLLIMGAMCCSYGTMISIMATLDQCLSKLGYKNSNTVTSSIILSFMISGILSTLAFTMVVKKTLAYKKVSIILLLGAFVCFTSLALTISLDINPQSHTFLILLSCCLGIFVVPQSAILIGYASQAVYPLGQASASGYLYAASQTIGFLVGLTVSGLISTQPTTIHIAFAVESLLFLAGAGFVLFSKEQLKRSKRGMEIRNYQRHNLDQSLVVRDNVNIQIDNQLMPHSD